MKRILFFTAIILTGMLCGIRAQEYYIEGFYERHGEGNYTLNNVHTNGIKLDGRTVLSETLYGDKKRISCDGVDATMVRFSFEKATTDCPTKWDGNFEFQYWDEDNNKWKTDVEACKGQTTSYSEKNMVIMLVLDYSYSMKENISRIQSSAIKFINSVSNVSQGNVHVGIIAFSGMDLAEKQVFEIMPLTRENKYKFERFIRNSNKGKETALYYSMDKAIRMLENYVLTQGFSLNKYNGACMITFTDGLDNASINDDISSSMQRGRKNEYLAEISKQLKGSNRKMLLGLPVENFGIGFSGSEKFTSEDLDFFRDVLMQTTPDENHFTLASRFEEVEAYFETITKSLIERWENLNMYVGEAQHGRIRWVLNCGRAPRPDNGTFRSPWFGISAEVGLLVEYLDKNFGGLNLDLTFSLNKTIAIGGRMGVFYYHDCWWYQHYYNDYYYEWFKRRDRNIGFLIGPEVKITFNNNSALLIGLGGGVLFDDFLYLSFGYKLKSPWFFTVEALMDYDAADFGIGVGVGYSFGGKLRNK